MELSIYELRVFLKELPKFLFLVELNYVSLSFYLSFYLLFISNCSFTDFKPPGWTEIGVSVDAGLS